MTHDELERALIEAIQREHDARICGAEILQAIATNEIRELRTLLQAQRSESSLAETENQAGESKCF